MLTKRLHRDNKYFLRVWHNALSKALEVQRMRKFLALVAALLCVLVTSACQPTPTEVFVIEKDTERMVKKASSDEQGTLSSALGVPEGNYTYQATDASGKLTVSADAVIAMPNVDYLPIARVTSWSFTDQDVENIYNAVCQGALPVDEDAPMPKFFYQHTLDRLLEDRESGNLDKYDTVEEQDAAIQEVMAQVASAPDQATPIAPNFSINSSGIEGIARILCVLNNEVVSDLFVTNSTRSGRGVDSDYIRDVFCRGEFAIQSVYGNGVTVSYGLTRDITLAAPNISQQEAQAIADQAVSTLGLSDFSLAGKRIAPLFDGNPKNGCKSLYEFMYTRIVNGVSVTYTNDISSWAPENPDSVSEGWMYEKLRIFVDDGGIYAYQWNGPYTVTEIVNEKATLLPFDQIKKIFENMILTKYGASGTEEGESASINITSVRLGLARVTEQNNNTYGLLVPAWDFFGVYDTGNGYPIGYDGFESLLTINAVDGSIIDRTTGY
jgi:hypothetical protein